MLGVDRRPSGSATRECLMASRLDAIDLAVMLPFATLYVSALTNPETKDSPRPKLASTEPTFRLDVRVGRKEYPGRLREDHLLHDHGHLDLPVVDAHAKAVGHRPLGKEGGPTSTDMPEDRR